MQSYGRSGGEGLWFTPLLLAMNWISQLQRCRDILKAKDIPEQGTNPLIAHQFIDFVTLNNNVITVRTTCAGCKNRRLHPLWD